MVLDNVLLSPLGLLALLATLPLILLYLIRPDPAERDLPTMRFLTDDRGEDASTPVFERLSRSLLLLIQLAAIVLLATSLATPYTLVSESSTVQETVVVVDGSASMATDSGGSTRFDRAVAAAGDAPTSVTSVVFVARQGEVVLRDGTPEQARGALDDLSVTDVSGDLRDGIAQASAVAGEEARIVVYSDFADDGGWEEAVEAARARGLLVDLRQFDGGGADNVGIVDRSFTGREVTVTVKNFGDSEAERTLSLGGQRESLTLGAGDVVTRTLAVPAGGGTVALSPGDSFPTDDTAAVAAPEDATVDVLLLTNDRNRYLATALSVIPEVELTVESPPANVEGTYDVVVYSNIQEGRLLRGNVADGEAALANGGGVVVQAQEGMPNRYVELLPVEVSDAVDGGSVGAVANDELTRDISYPPPERHLVAETADGTRTLVGLTDGSPLVATAERDGGRVLYYGYLEDASSFKFNYQYPVFWKRAVFYLAGRDPLPTLNRPTGDQLRFAEERTVRTPSGTVTARMVSMDEQGFYEVDGRRYGAALLSESESAVATDPLDERTEGSVRSREEDRQVPDPLTEWVALGALGVVVVELGYLRRRGDL
ncbi:N-terminal double-transmembrane domain-containing protein [Halogranum gelatinilyticum]|uniref:N-terminal double-transmembrane domain-containing protein n=1 Tax=Halogranum gelatinilyticum TaxID=660521 RepID=A0A1G9XDS6_9EURY|nr:VWA domain-containing protein [Halogranum gelatinilyticum]SDM94463.1 N-terminal double-transmembrane domain-containing protein [Halogranum gelatinilyticum]